MKQRLIALGLAALASLTVLSCTSETAIPTTSLDGIARPSGSSTTPGADSAQDVVAEMDRAVESGFVCSFMSASGQVTESYGFGVRGDGEEWVFRVKSPGEYAVAYGETLYVFAEMEDGTYPERTMRATGVEDPRELLRIPPSPSECVRTAGEVLQTRESADGGTVFLRFTSREGTEMNGWFYRTAETKTFIVGEVGLDALQLQIVLNPKLDLQTFWGVKERSDLDDTSEDRPAAEVEESARFLAARPA